MLNRLKQWWRERQVIRECGCICWCPDCRNILNDNAEVEGIGTPIITYTCNDCGLKSKFDFWAAPVPIYIPPAGRRQND